MTDTENNLFKKVFKLYLRGIEPIKFKVNKQDLDILVIPNKHFIYLYIGDEDIIIPNNVMEYVMAHNEEPFVDEMNGEHATQRNIGWEDYEPTDEDYYNYLMSEL